MDKLSVTEGLVAILADRDSVDGTNAIQLLRNAQERCMETYDIPGQYMPTSTHPNAIKERWLNRQRDAEEVDDIIILASRNGGVDIFA